jgi:hypothetical protein
LTRRDGGILTVEVTRMEALVAVPLALVVVGSCAWVFLDAPAHGLSRWWVAGCLVFWLVAFPWYLVARTGRRVQLKPSPPDPYPLKLPPGYRPPAPMVPPPPPPGRARSRRPPAPPPD